MMACYFKNQVQNRRKEARNVEGAPAKQLDQII